MGQTCVRAVLGLVVLTLTGCGAGRPLETPPAAQRSPSAAATSDQALVGQALVDRAPSLDPGTRAAPAPSIAVLELPPSASYGRDALLAPPGGLRAADGGDDLPATASGTQRERVSPRSSPTRTCSMYSSSASYGVLCSDVAAGVPLEVSLRAVGIDIRDNGAFCWDDPDLPDDFVAPWSTTGPGAWWVHTCLSFAGDVFLKRNALLSYEYRYVSTTEVQTLTPAQEAVLHLLTDWGRIPVLQLATSPVASPRVEQDIAFSLVCSDRVVCTDTAGGRRVQTPAIRVGGVLMHAELVGLRVLPLGASGPTADAVTCSSGGLTQTAEQLDAAPDAGDDGQVCRFRYRRSSDEAGRGDSRDRYPVSVSAYWQVYFDAGGGVQPLGLAYAKPTTQQLRVTEVQTLVVS